MTSTRAVVMDIGGVLEVIDDTVFPGPFERRHSLSRGSVVGALALLPGDPMVGEVGEEAIRQAWRSGLGLSEEATDELVADYWRWYVGTLDRELFAWFAAAARACGWRAVLHRRTDQTIVEVERLLTR